MSNETYIKVNDHTAFTIDRLGRGDIFTTAYDPEVQRLHVESVYIKATIHAGDWRPTTEVRRTEMGIIRDHSPLRLSFAVSESALERWQKTQLLLVATRLQHQTL